MNQETPVRVNLPSGKFTVNFVGADGKPDSRTVTVDAANKGSINLEGVDASDIEKIVSSSN